MTKIFQKIAKLQRQIATRCKAVVVTNGTTTRCKEKY